MRVSEILQDYSDDALDRLARDKVDEISSLRFPREVLIQEVASALSSHSYVAKSLAPARPPSYAILKILLGSPNYASGIEGFRDRALELTDRLSEMAGEGSGLCSGKNYELYVRMLHAAWEDDAKIDRSEALLLAALRKELGIWMREHLLLEHHPDVREIWDTEKAYEQARNHLLGSGLVLLHEGSYRLAEEVCLQIRRVWEMSLEDGAYRRLLERLRGTQLRDALEASELPLSGSKEEKVRRLVEGLVPPELVLDTLHIDHVKELCRELDLPVSAAKAELIESIIVHFDTEADLRAEEPPTPLEVELQEPEPRLLDDDRFRRLLAQLTVDLLYDVLASKRLPRSGSKARRIERLVASGWSEVSLLSGLRRADLADLCRKLSVPVSGIKRELVDHLIEWADQDLTPAEATDSSTLENVEPSEECTESTSDEGEEAIASMEHEANREAPTLLPEVRAGYPELERDEQIVVALLKEAKSLTEGEVEKAARHHTLGWTLAKAHMAELIAKLRSKGKRPIAIRSSGSTNIYEWRSLLADLGKLETERRAARDVIEALRQGVVPDRHLDMLAVGQDRIRKALIDALKNARGDRSCFRFLKGQYGAGKTFLSAWLRDRALESDYAVSTVKIGPDQPLSDLPVFFSAFADGLRTAEKRAASALADLLESWILELHRDVDRESGHSPTDPKAQEARAREVEARIEQAVAHLAGIDPGFGPASRAYYRARLEDDLQKAGIALSWLRGSHSLPASTLREIGVRGQLGAEQVFPRMRAILQVIGGSRFKGLLVIIDELELVRRFPHARQRDRAYETLRLLIDECGENRLPGCLILCTGTDQLFQDERYGIPSYPALSQRIDPSRISEGAPTTRQTILPIETLGEDRLLQIVRKVRDIHGTAYEWVAQERVGNDLLKRLVDQWTTFGEERVERLPRPVLKEIVELLDLCEERPEISAERFLGETRVGQSGDSLLNTAGI